MSSLAEAARMRDLEERVTLLTRRIDQIEGTNNWLRDELKKAREEVAKLQAVKPVKLERAPLHG